MIRKIYFKRIGFRKNIDGVERIEIRECDARRSDQSAPLAVVFVGTMPGIAQL